MVDQKTKNYTQIHRVDSYKKITIETGIVDVSELENEIKKHCEVK